eukprot:3983894-Pyramimonas_sp.AAC.1
MASGSRWPPQTSRPCTPTAMILGVPMLVASHWQGRSSSSNFSFTSESCSSRAPRRGARRGDHVRIGTDHEQFIARATPEGGLGAQ